MSNDIIERLMVVLGWRKGAEPETSYVAILKMERPACCFDRVMRKNWRIAFWSCLIIPRLQLKWLIGAIRILHRNFTLTRIFGKPKHSMHQLLICTGIISSTEWMLLECLGYLPKKHGWSLGNEQSY